MWGRTVQGAARAVRNATKNATKDLSKQTRNYSWHYDKYRYSGGHAPKQWGQGAPYFLGYWHHGVCRSVLERSGWALFFFIPIEAAWLFYDFGFRRIDAEMGPFISDHHRYDGTPYDEVEKEVRYRWATDGTLCQYPQEHAERRA
eukprot:gene14260-21872_t